MVSFFSKLRSELKIGTVFTLAGIIIAAFNLIFGAGTPFDLISSPQLRFEIRQIRSTVANLNECMIENPGTQLAENLIVQLTFEDDVSLLEDIIIQGGDGQYNIDSGGFKGDNHAVVSLERLVAKDKIMMVLSTDASSKLLCDVTSNTGKAIPSTEGSSFVTITTLFWSQLLSTLIIALLVLSLRNGVVNNMGNSKIEEKREQSNGN